MPRSSVSALSDKEYAQVMDRRTREQQRLLKIKDPKLYNKLDTDFLDKQVLLKEQQRQDEKRKQEEYAKQMNDTQAKIDHIELLNQIDRSQTLKELSHFQKTVQTKESRRDFDLTGFQGVSARESDDDPRLSVSGVQKFDGEDLHKPHRVKMQQREISQWSAEAVALKEQQKKEQIEEALSYSKSSVEQDKHITQLEEELKDARREATKELADFNRSLVAAKRENELSKRLAEEQLNMQEIQYQLSSTILTEDPSMGRSYIAPNRLRPDHYKGMTVEERQMIFQERDAQLSMLKKAREAEKATDEMENSSIRESHLLGLAYDEQLERRRAEMRRAILDENLQLAKSQTMNRSQMEEVFANSINESFFDKFNTTAR